MNRYPTWGYALIAIAVVLAFLYTLPNFFGESPAVQISARQTVKVDPALLQKVQDVLKQANVPGGVRPESGIRVRFEDTDTQLKAKDLIHSTLNPGAAPRAAEDDANVNYVVALNLLPASPAWLTAIHALPMYLGLDLRGGVHFSCRSTCRRRPPSAWKASRAIRSQLREKACATAA